MDEYQDHLARINCVLDQAALELETYEYHELLGQIESELLERLEPSDDEDGDTDMESGE